MALDAPTLTIDPEIGPRLLTNILSLGHAHACEWMNPKMLSIAQMQALQALAIKTNLKLTGAMMTWDFRAAKDIRIAALNKLNHILYGPDFAQVTADKLEAVDEDSSPFQIAA